MEKNTRRHRVLSDVSDEELAMIIAREYTDRPEEFSSSNSSYGITGITCSKDFLSKTSGRGIKPLLKWL